MKKMKLLMKKEMIVQLVEYFKFFLNKKLYFFLFLYLKIIFTTKQNC